MSKKVKMYRVELFNDYTPIIGMRSDFSKQASLEDARLWAIERGRKGGADYVRLYEKSENRYNSYNYVAELSTI